MTDLADVESLSKLVEGCRLTLSAISFARRVVRHPETQSEFVVLMSVRVMRLSDKGSMMEVSSRWQRGECCGGVILWFSTGVSSAERSFGCGFFVREVAEATFRSMQFD